MSKHNPKAAITQVPPAATVVEDKKEDGASSQSELGNGPSNDGGNEGGESLENLSANSEDAAKNGAEGAGNAEPELTVTPTPAPVPAPQAVVVRPTPTPAVPKPTVAEASADKVVVEEATVASSGKNELKEQLAKILKSVPDAYHSDIFRIQTYVERMEPNRPITVPAGAKEQVALYRAIQNIINRQDKYFTQLFTAALAIFKAEMKGALGDKYRLRFLESVELSVGDRKAFQYITHLMFVTADPKSRAMAISTVNIAKALENGLTAEGRDRVLKYYNA